MTPPEAGGPDGPSSSSGTGGPRAFQIDVVVLAGGTGRRLGGASKPDVVVRGARLLDHVLGGLDSLRGSLPLGRVVVVAPDSVALPDGVLRALEDPPLGGPVAGVAAGLDVLASAPGGSAPLTALLTCDAPESWRALPGLAAALGSAAGPDDTEVVGTAAGVGRPSGHGRPDGAVAVAGSGADRHVQYLLGLYRTASLRRAVTPGGEPLRDVSVRRTVGALAVLEVERTEQDARDLDTWDEVRRWELSGDQ